MNTERKWEETRWFNGIFVQLLVLLIKLANKNESFVWFSYKIWHVALDV